MTTEKNETKDLLVISETFLAKTDIFTIEGMRPLIDKIKTETDLVVLPDTSTGTNRDEIKALAYMVTRSKTLIDDTGKKKNEAARKKLGIVDQARKLAREELTAHAAEIRRPVTEWEDAEAKRIEAERIAEEKRIQGIKAKVEAIRAKPVDSVGKNSSLLKTSLLVLKGMVIDPEEFAEFTEEATLVKNYSVQRLSDMVDAAKLKEQEAARVAEEKKKLAADQEKLAADQEKLDTEKVEVATEKAEVKTQKEEIQTRKEQAPIGGSSKKISYGSPTFTMAEDDPDSQHGDNLITCPHCSKQFKL